MDKAAPAAFSVPAVLGSFGNATFFLLADLPTWRCLVEEVLAGLPGSLAGNVVSSIYFKIETGVLYALFVLEIAGVLFWILEEVDF